jgi:hypothetical protein
VARIDNDNLPTFEFNMQFCPASGSCYPGKRWCLVTNGITSHNENARKICESLGTVDTTSGVTTGDYYVLN